MPLAGYGVANTWLDGTKLTFADDAAAAPFAGAADALIRAYLFDSFPEHVNKWTASTPSPPTSEATPELVQQIAGRLMASYYYRAKYSETTDNSNDYATKLEADAMMLLAGLKDGSIELADVTYPESIAVALDSGNFYPNDATGALDPDAERKFDM